MPSSLDNRLVIGVASSAMFDRVESDGVFRSQGEAACRRYQEEHLHAPERLPSTRVHSAPAKASRSDSRT